MLIKDPHRKEHQDDADGYRINNHRFGIELQMLLVTCADAGYADNQQRRVSQLNCVKRCELELLGDNPERLFLGKLRWGSMPLLSFSPLVA